MGRNVIGLDFRAVARELGSTIVTAAAYGEAR